MMIREMLAAIQKMFDASDAQIKSLREDISSRDAEIKTLREKLTAANQIIASRNAEIKTLRDNLADSNKKIAALETELADRNSRLANFLELERAFNLYRKLPENTRFALEGVFGAANNPTNFLGGALQEGHLESLFDYTATALNNGVNPDETEILSCLLDFTLDAVNNGRREKIFARLDTKTGDDFDRDTMRKSSGSSQSGSVQKILLAGYRYIQSGNVVKPSLVSLA